MAFGNYEPISVQLVTKILKPGMHCIDAGAQIGYYTCILATCVGKTGKVWAFEPMPSNYQLLVKNIKENGLENIVQPYELACSDSNSLIEGTMTTGMYIVGEIGTGTRITMESIRVDDLIKEAVDIVKIDIEGHEPAALNGMRVIISENNPIIFSEINEYWLRLCSNSNGNEYISFLNSLGYDVYDVKNLRKPIAAGSLKLDILDTMNIVAFPKGSKPLDTQKSKKISFLTKE